MFETQDGFRDSSSTLRVVKLVYQLADGQIDSVLLESQATLVYELICWADINADGQINLVDLLYFKDAFDKSESDAGWSTEIDGLPALHTPFKRYDGSGDGVVNLSDFVLFTTVFGRSCSP